jgi:hypothetical protein
MREPASNLLFPPLVITYSNFHAIFPLFRIARLLDVSVFNLSILDKMKEGRVAKLINFGNQVIGSRRHMRCIRPANLYCMAEVAKGDNAKNVFMKVTRYHAQTYDACDNPSR